MFGALIGKTILTERNSYFKLCIPIIAPIRHHKSDFLKLQCDKQ